MLISFLLMLVAALVAQLLIPFWWIAAPVVAAVAFLRKMAAGRAFLAGFAAVFVLWLIFILLKDIPNGSLLSTQMASLLPLGGNHVLLIVVSAFIGGLVSGLAAMAGAALRPALGKA